MIRSAVMVAAACLALAWPMPNQVVAAWAPGFTLVHAGIAEDTPLPRACWLVGNRICGHGSTDHG